MQVEKMVVVSVDPEDIYDACERDHEQLLEMIVELDACVNDGEFTSRAIAALESTLQDQPWSIWRKSSTGEWELIDESEPHGKVLDGFTKLHSFMEADASIAEVVFESFQEGYAVCAGTVPPSLREAAEGIASDDKDGA